MATLIKTDETQQTVYPQNGKDFSAEEIHELIGGFFEFIYCEDGSIIAVDEEGKLKNKDINITATRFTKLNCTYIFNDVIVGNALVMAPGEVN